MTDGPAGSSDLPERVGRALTGSGLRLISAESCTGGLLAARLTEVAGASAWFEGAFVTYRLTAKVDMLGVTQTGLARHGAVSEPTARGMAEGALHNSSADVSVAITGIAGPDGGDVITPVGTVWFGWALRQGGIRCVQTAEHHLAGDRQVVREQAVRIALEGVLELA